jgi:signal transduction histidine kinase
MFRPIAYLLAILVFFATYSILKNNSSKNYSREINKIQKKFLVQENKLFETAEEIKNDSLHYKNFSKYISLYNNYGILVFIEKDEKTIFWNSNTVSLQSPLKDSTSIISLKNGWYYYLSDNVNNYKIKLLAHIKYKYENKHVKNNFDAYYNTKIQAEISEEKGKYNIKNNKGEHAFSVEIDENTSPYSNAVYYILGFLSISLLILIPLFVGESVYMFVLKRKGKAFVSLFTVLLMVALRYLSLLYKFPQVLYENEFFSPLYFARSELMPSLGDLFFNVLILAFSAILIYRRINFNFIRKINSFILLGIALASFLFTFIVLRDFLEEFIINSIVSLSFRSIFEISWLAIISISSVFFIALTLLIPSFIVLHKFRGNKTNFIVLIIASIVIITTYHLISNCLVESIFLTILLALVCVQLIIKKTIKKTSFVLLLLLFFSLFITHKINQQTSLKEYELRKMKAIELSEERDPIAEFQFDEVEQKIIKDDTLLKMLSIPSFDEEAVSEYIIKNYFSNYWAKYSKQITYCFEADSLFVNNNEKELCSDFFHKMLEEIGLPTFNPNLFYINDGSGRNKYLVWLKFFENDSAIPVLHTIIEFNSIFMPQSLGYPELLIDENITTSSIGSEYALAKYKAGEMIYRYGNYFYWFKLPKELLKENEFDFFDYDGYNHLVYRPDINSAIIISKEKEGLIERISPIAYIVFIFSILLLLFVYLLRYPLNFKEVFRVKFKTRIQFSIVFIIVISFIIIGITSIVYMYQNNKDKNTDVLTEKTHSVLIEIEHKIGDANNLDEVNQEYLSNLLMKFSNVFFSDIHIFDVSGKLFASSRPEIFDEALISPNMNPEAYNQLKVENKSFYVHQEKIASLSYLSAYVPFVNYNGEIIAYINLPYFARQNKIENEISSYISAFLNIYLILIALAIALGVFVSGYLVRPLKRIQESMKKISLGKPNEKISWKTDDEIGDMIKEYNKMIDELTESAQILAKSERELAWREMAKQVAHEIKNPLTPMKLNVQYIQKAWQDKSPDWEEQLKRFSERLIEQIDALSNIATAFSDFAKMPQTEFTDVNIVEVINNSVELFYQGSKLEIEFINETEQEQLYIKADKSQIVRVFNNLIKNAQQAMQDVINPQIIIKLKPLDDNILIVVEDNGCGIANEMEEKIFIPQFTTKTGGTGLGLPMIKNIIDATSGKIWFESEVGKGTKFYVIFKMIKDEDNN